MENDQKRAFVAVILSALILFSWQYFFGPKKPLPSTEKTPETMVSTPNGQTTTTTTTLPKTGLNNVETIKQVADRVIQLKTESDSFALKNSLLMGALNNSNAIYPFDETINEAWPVQILFKNARGEVSVPNFSQVSEQTESSVLLSNGSGSLRFTLTGEGVVNIQAKNLGENRLLFRFEAKEKDLGQGKIRSFVAYANDLFKKGIGDDGQQDGSLRWAGIDFKYHLFALNFPTAVQSKIQTSEMNTNTNKAQMFIELGNKLDSIDFDLMYIKKNYDQLDARGNGLQMSVDYGFFSLISVPMLRSLQFFYKYVRNYGFAIILLTLLIRLLTFPLQYKSIKSMKKMQTVQPELAKIKEKYKDNPQRMQQESMALFKRAGANPISGCFPMLLQMPIFFAFYSVLRESIELVNAPFIGWIQDLSSKDPYYVIPILMALAMFMQQRLTPSPSTDPTQKKVMMFMPVIFGLFMLNLPSGLTLYILVSTLFGIGQQLLVFKRMS